jgi:hypothetical protein|tara:strand:- start:1358 stop:1558 length:201 start_codon:yes stop_codon:yes gene_type:complete
MFEPNLTYQERGLVSKDMVEGKLRYTGELEEDEVLYEEDLYEMFQVIMTMHGSGILIMSDYLVAES